jgi:ankyrin repeat protein
MRLYMKFISYLVSVVGIFVSAGASAGAYEDFFHAVSRDDGRTIATLLQRGFDPNSRDEQGQAALYVVLRQPSPAAAEALWAHPALDINATNAAGESPLMMAALRGNLVWATKLVARGAKVHLEGWSPIHYAATGPEPELVRLLLDKGAPVDARSPNGSTPLMMAARYGSEASVDLLLARGANPKLRNQRDLTAADFARMDGRDALAQRLQSLSSR